MDANRRGFVTVGLAAVTDSLAPRPAPAQDDPPPPEIDGLPVIDYGRSFVCGTAPFNNVRFWVESRTILFSGDRTYECLQLGSCKSENTFGEKDLFLADNYDFLPILGPDDQWLIFRRRNRITEDYRRLQREVWGPAVRKLKYGRTVAVLDSFAAIRDATVAGIPLVSRTELVDRASGRRAVIEAPVKTMNIQPEERLYQIDTGPVAYPRLSEPFDPPIDALQLAFVAFNAAHFADFVVEQPDPVVEDGVEKTKVFHYSQPFSVPARNLLLAIGD